MTVFDVNAQFPGRFKVQRGALIVYPNYTAGAQPSAIVYFQFNPDTMKRTLAHRAPPAPDKGSSGAAKEDVMRVGGPPIETITLTVDLTASGQLEDPDKNAQTAPHGLHPALATLELLMYPPTLRAQDILKQAKRGDVQVAPADLPLVLLAFGKNRIVPVKITSFSVSEEMYDSMLNPIAAKVDLGVQVLTYMEFPQRSVGFSAFIAYQQLKESLRDLDTRVSRSPAPAEVTTLERGV